MDESKKQEVISDLQDVIYKLRGIDSDNSSPTSDSWSSDGAEAVDIGK